MYILLHVYYLITGITSSPLSVNVSIYKVAVFNCTAIADSVNWLINDTPLDDRPGFYKTTVTLNQTNNLHKSTLSAVASAVNNKTNIKCVVIRKSPFTALISEPALLLIQGSYLCM